MFKRYTCSECGEEFPKSKMDKDSIKWYQECGDEIVLQCKACCRASIQAGIDAMDPDGNGYDEWGVWDEERLGF